MNAAKENVVSANICCCLPVPQVGPVPLDAEDEVDQIKDIVVVLNMINMANGVHCQGRGG